MAEAVNEVPPRVCRDRATKAAENGDVAIATAWAVLAISGDLAELRRELRRTR